MMTSKSQTVARITVALLLIVVSYLLPRRAAASDTMTIAQARAAADGTAVSVQGTVTVGTMVFDDTGRNFYIQDATGGVNIFFGKGGLPKFVEGDTLQITGKMGTFANHREIILDNVDTAKKSNTDAPKPLTPVTIHTIEGAAHAGQLARMQGFIVAGSTDFFVITDNSDLNQGDVNVYLYDTAGIGFSAVASKQTVCVTGIVEPYNANLEILPRSPSDVVMGDCPTS